MGLCEALQRRGAWRRGNQIVVCECGIHHEIRPDGTTLMGNSMSCKCGNPIDNCILM